LANAKAADNPSEEYNYSYELWPLFFCGAQADALIQCDTTGAAPSADDSDGDGLANSADNCPQVWNPDQGNLDGDKVGDACDVCALVPDATTCAKAGPDDTDGDGVANATDNCKSKPNADQMDGDKDGRGDLCDPCPDKANPAPQECPVEDVAVTALNQDLTGIAVGDKVRVKDLQITAVLAGNPAKVWAQKVPGEPWGGIMLELPKGASTQAQIGQTVSATGRGGQSVWAAGPAELQPGPGDRGGRDSGATGRAGSHLGQDPGVRGPTGRCSSRWKTPK
jgi:hypothetical protein